MAEGPTLYLSAFIDELVRSGVHDIVISPGSRSTPLAVLAAEHANLRVWMNVDERSAGFFALGLAKAKRRPAALLCTSGTAAANYMPAVAEANLARVPLIVLTADRPHELRDVGAPQTIQQIDLYGKHVRWFMEMPIPESTSHMIRHARITAARAVTEAGGLPAGPVHLNFPLREPLLPDLDHPGLFGAGREAERPYVQITSGAKTPDSSYPAELLDQLRGAQRGVIICGPQDEPGFADAVSELAERLGYPLLADPLSQLRSGHHPKGNLIEAYDAFLRDEETAEQLRPQVILRFGAMPVSKPLLQYMNRHADSRMIIIDEAGWRDPTLLASDMIFADSTTLCRELIGLLAESAADKEDGSEWLRKWQQINTLTKQVLVQGANDPELEGLFEGRVFTELRELMLPETVLFAGNSMPIRDLDTFYGSDEQQIRFLGNRGANGIDGLISTALGVSAAGKRTVLVLGDLSFYHDMNGLLAAKLHDLSLIIIVVNNDGGGIFSFLPQAGLPRHFEELFGTPIGLDYSHAAAMYGASFARVRTWEEFRAAYKEAFEAGGLAIIEVPTDRAANVEQHREIWRKLADRLAEVREED